MTEHAKTVVVAGATGRTGRHVVREALRRGYLVRALRGRPGSAVPEELQEPGITCVQTDLWDLQSLEKAVQGARFIISALGSKKPFTTHENDRIDNMANQNLARAARAQGIEHIVLVSSIGCGDSRPAVFFLFRLLMTPVLQAKEKSEAFLRSCGVAYTIIRPGALTDKALPGTLAFGEGGKITGRIQRRQVGRACVDALESPSMKNRTLEVVDASTVAPEKRPDIITL